jgi:hypothetical protein
MRTHVLWETRTQVQVRNQYWEEAHGVRMFQYWKATRPQGARRESKKCKKNWMRCGLQR